jgi:hypothetical protein
MSWELLERFAVFSLSESGKKSGLARAAAVLATGFGISFGLCGLNAIAITSIPGRGAGFLLVTAYLELAGMIICAAGLIVVAVVAIFRFFASRSGAPSGNERSE